MASQDEEEAEMMKEVFVSQHIPEDMMEFTQMFSMLNDSSIGPAGTAYIGGYNLFTFIPLFWSKIYNFPIDENDVVVSSFPKCGTTWLQQIVYLIMTENFEAASTVPIDVRVPFLEIPQPLSNAAYDQLAARPKPNLLKTHLPPAMLPKSISKGKMIYCYRNAKDAVVSYYHHYKAMCLGPNKFRGTFEEFARRFIDGDVAFGPYHKHVRAYDELAKTSSSLLVLRYEDMKKDRKATIRKIAAFLGKALSEETIDKITEATSFETMKANDATNYSHFVKLKIWDGEPFIRKGVVGDWRNHFTDSKLLAEFENYIQSNVPKELIIETD